MLRIILIVVILGMLLIGYSQFSKVDPVQTAKQPQSAPNTSEVTHSNDSLTQVNSEETESSQTKDSASPVTKQLIDTTSDSAQAEPMSDEQKTAAQTHLDKITEEPKQTIEALTAQHFVRGNQLIQLPESGALSIAITPELGTQIPNPNQFNTAVKPSQTITPASPANATTVTTATAATTFGVAVSTFNPGSQQVNSESEPQNTANQSPDTSATESSGSQLASQATTQAATQATPKIGSLVQLKELINQPDENHEERFFYIHAVNNADEQGLWGIIQGGLTNTFSQGIQLPEVGSTVQAHIPEEADEVLNNRNSSFLGKLLHEKVESTYIYNYTKGLLGQNPDMIKPGQQLIIVSFTESELMRVYQHFTQ